MAVGSTQHLVSSASHSALQIRDWCQSVNIIFFGVMLNAVLGVGEK
jgi:hypothetical protein